MASNTLIEVKNLVTAFETESGLLNAVDGVSFALEEGKTLGIVGESGCGKSVTSLSIMGLLPQGVGKIRSGNILYRGQELTKFTENQMRKIRGNEIAMIFQEPMTSLNPVFTIGNQIREAIALHQKDLSRREIADRAVDMLKLVGIPAPEKRVEDYPHQLSGGMRQRVMIAMALSCNPKLLIADEPTTALDVTIQAQILELLKGLQQQLKMGLILITHDLGVVAEMSDDVMVMYAGKVVEYTTAQSLFNNPLHPYTRGLLNSLPQPGKRKRLEAIPGIVPSLSNLPKGCRFQDRCHLREEQCVQAEPELRELGTSSESHHVRCVRA